MHKTVHTHLRSSGLSHKFEQSQASPGALSTNSCGMRDKMQHETYCLILKDTIHKIDARQPGKKIAGHL